MNINYKEWARKYFIVFPITIYLILYLTTLGQDPLFGDEEPESLVNNFPNILLEQKFDSLKKPINISKEPNLFYPGSYINPEKAKDGLTVSKFQPVVSVVKEGEKLPLFINARNSGLPYFLFKQTIKIFGFKVTKNLFDISIGIGTLVFFNLACLRKFPNVSRIATIILSASPLFNSSMNVYIGEQFLALLFWMMLYFIEGSSKQKVFACLLFLLGIHIKLNYVFLFLPLAVLSPNAFLKNKKHFAITTVLSLAYCILILSLPFSEDELLSSNHYIKPFAHLSFFFQEMIQFFVAPIKFLTMYVDTTGFTYLHNKTLDNFKPLLSFGAIEYLNTILFLPLFLLTLKKDGNARKVFYLVLVWCLVIFFLAHIDQSYTHRIVTTNTLISLLISFTVLRSFKLNKLLGIALIILQITFYFTWIYQFNKIGPRNHISTSLHIRVKDYLIENKIKKPLITGSRTAWGMLELLSNEQVTPIYFNSYDRNIPIKKAFQMANGPYLIHMPIKRVRPRVHYDPDYTGYTKKEILDYANLAQVTLTSMKEFHHKGRLIYWLVNIEQDSRKFHKLSEHEKNKLRDIGINANYR